jgi:hypothetical protein
MKKYYPINLTNQIKNIILLQMMIKKFILVPVIILILQFINVKKKQIYVNRHKKNENWNDKVSAGAWSR